MRLSLREMARRPGRFAVAVGMLTLLAVLLLLLGGLLDGLSTGSTGAVRAQEGELLTFSGASRNSFVRSQVSPRTRAVVEAVPGVRRTRGLGVTLVGARVQGRDTFENAAVWGYQGGVRGVPAPPPAGEAWVDRRLEAAGAEVGDTLRLGPSGVPVRIRGFVSDTSYLLQAGVWVSPAEWRRVTAEVRPDRILAPGTFQVLSVATGPGTDPAAVATAIDRATAPSGGTSTLTKAAAIDAIPGVKSQRGTFTFIINTTLLVAAVVVALFFALLTLERTALYGVLKAIGASSTQIVRGLFVQAAVVAVVALVIGEAVALGLGAVIPREVPLLLEPSRAVTSAISVLVAALVGSAISVRRIIRIDPATAIGGGA
ncbi:MAG: FtsX-like permease family protein [Actinomycetes bacterium]